ncbi:MAG: acetyltransferase [Pseudomonadota bacterium]
MIKELIYFIRFFWVMGLIVINTILVFSIVFFIVVAKVFFSKTSFNTFLTKWLVIFSELWIDNNNKLVKWFVPVRFTVTSDLNPTKIDVYLVISNHQSWSDILVLQNQLNRKLPPFKFFLKKELIWIPLMGIVWWAQDNIFMHRHTKKELERNPALQGKDLEITQRACAKFKKDRVTIINFVEGTRYTGEKHAKQKSPYRHLLKPKTGGVAFTLAAMAGRIETLLDVSIHYASSDPTLYKLLSGQIPEIKILIQTVSIPKHFSESDYNVDNAFKVEIQQWLSDRWLAKDAWLDQQSKHN